MSQVGRKILADKIKFYRSKADIKKEHLSLEIGRDPSYMSKLENLSVNISIDRLEEILAVLGIDILEFFKSLV